eukprot:2543808-Alexandrium_andersonii.AAC.1
MPSAFCLSPLGLRGVLAGRLRRSRCLCLHRARRDCPLLRFRLWSGCRWRATLGVLRSVVPVAVVAVVGGIAGAALHGDDVVVCLLLRRSCRCRLHQRRSPGLVVLVGAGSHLMGLPGSALHLVEEVAVPG